MNKAADRSKATAPPNDAQGGALEQYDAGLLGDFGGGNVAWWHDCIRVQLEQAHEFYQAQVDALAREPAPQAPVDAGEGQRRLDAAVQVILDSLADGESIAQAVQNARLLERPAPAHAAWTCECGQRNTSWAVECGRCERKLPTAQPATPKSRSDENTATSCADAGVCTTCAGRNPDCGQCRGTGYTTPQPPAPARVEVEQKYDELLFAVAKKWPGESRHETALRYIRERESCSVDALAPTSLRSAAAGNSASCGANQGDK